MIDRNDTYKTNHRQQQVIEIPVPDMSRVEQLLEQLIERVEAVEKVLLKKTEKKEILGMQEAAEFLNVSRSTLYKLCHQNLIPRYKGGQKGGKNLFRKEDLQSYLEVWKY